MVCFAFSNIETAYLHRSYCLYQICLPGRGLKWHLFGHLGRVWLCLLCCAAEWMQACSSERWNTHSQCLPVECAALCLSFLGYLGRKPRTMVQVSSSKHQSRAMTWLGGTTHYISISVHVKLQELLHLGHEPGLTISVINGYVSFLLLQIFLWEQNLEQFHMDLFRFRCYLASLQGGELPNPKRLLAVASRPTKLAMGRLGIFSVSSFHALVSMPIKQATSGATHFEFSLGKITYIYELNWNVKKRLFFYTGEAWCWCEVK